MSGVWKEVFVGVSDSWTLLGFDAKAWLAFSSTLF